MRKRTTLVRVGARSLLGFFTLEVLSVKVEFNANRAACLLAGVGLCVAMMLPACLVLVSFPCQYLPGMSSLFEVQW